MRTDTHGWKTFRRAAPAVTFHLAAMVGCANAQTTLSIDHFDGAKSWPVYSPGDLQLDNDKLGNLRVAYDGVFATPNGPLELATYIDLIDVMFNGTPADPNLRLWRSAVCFSLHESARRSGHTS